MKAGGTGTVTEKGNVYLPYLQVGGFRGREGFVSGRPMEVGRISFTFELSCASDCEFVFMEVGDRCFGVKMHRVTMNSISGPMYTTQLSRKNKVYCHSSC